MSVVLFFSMYRLGFFLFSRILRDGFDRRFNKAKNNPAHFFFFWTMQGKLFPVLNLFRTKTCSRLLSV